MSYLLDGDFFHLQGPPGMGPRMTPPRGPPGGPMGYGPMRGPHPGPMPPMSGMGGPRPPWPPSAMSPFPHHSPGYGGPPQGPGGI